MSKQSESKAKANRQERKLTQNENKAKAKPKPQPIKKYKSFLEYVPASDCFSDIDYSSIITDIDIFFETDLKIRIVACHNKDVLRYDDII